MCICRVTGQTGNYFTAECESPNGKKFYAIQAENVQDALVKARQMCLDDIARNNEDSINLNETKNENKS